MKERTIIDVWKRYEEAELTFPSWSRLELFSWLDMKILRAEIKKLEAEITRLTSEKK